ncbi:hypothetical protein ODZ84_19125 [Chryseobacterium fluminis]|uniref:hypothetical protein n=1 Tax=Chryseobacterium fluminis TaxID=2983606 RepID=UPI002258B686|nr:hypothetical protein [Chryseobacterium sp. MMS21-Ot14]UZT97279.1 hypothetical protein ODZ84_19125 [Chryseobacterium sp. MMS21-Ot14]
MKKLNVSQMENLQGSGHGRDCALKGAAILGMGAVAAFYPAVLAGMIGLASTAGDCFP